MPRQRIICLFTYSTKRYRRIIIIIINSRRYSSQGTGHSCWFVSLGDYIISLKKMFIARWSSLFSFVMEFTTRLSVSADTIRISLVIIAFTWSCNYIINCIFLSHLNIVYCTLRKNFEKKKRLISIFFGCKKLNIGPILSRIINYRFYWIFFFFISILWISICCNLQKLQHVS